MWHAVQPGQICQLTCLCAVYYGDLQLEEDYNAKTFKAAANDLRNVFLYPSALRDYLTAK